MNEFTPIGAENPHLPPAVEKAMANGTFGEALQTMSKSDRLLLQGMIREHQDLVCAQIQALGKINSASDGVRSFLSTITLGMVNRLDTHKQQEMQRLQQQCERLCQLCCELCKQDSGDQSHSVASKHNDSFGGAAGAAAMLVNSPSSFGL